MSKTTKGAMASPSLEEAAPLLLEAGDESCGILNGDSQDTINFNPNGDPDNPLEWPAPFKRGIVALLAFTGFTVYVQ